MSDQFARQRKESSGRQGKVKPWAKLDSMNDELAALEETS